MRTFSTRLAVLTLLGAMTGLSPTQAAPQNMGPGNGAGLDCSLPDNANDPTCLQAKPPSQPGPGKGNVPYTPPGGSGAPGPGTNQPGPTPGGRGAPPQPQQQQQQQQQQMGQRQGGGGGGGFNFSRSDRNSFHQRFRGFNFGFFPAPSFSVNLGVVVPRNFGLRPVPRSIYRFYPQFRGYLFFVTRRGDVVIVSRRTYRIVAVI